MDLPREVRLDAVHTRRGHSETAGVSLVDLESSVRTFGRFDRNGVSFVTVGATLIVEQGDYGRFRRQIPVSIEYG